MVIIPEGHSKVYVSALPTHSDKFPAKGYAANGTQYWLNESQTLMSSALGIRTRRPGSRRDSWRACALPTCSESSWLLQRFVACPLWLRHLQICALYSVLGILGSVIELPTRAASVDPKFSSGVYASLPASFATLDPFLGVEGRIWLAGAVAGLGRAVVEPRSI